MHIVKIASAFGTIGLAWCTPQQCQVKDFHGKCAAGLEEDGGLAMLQHVARAAEVKAALQPSSGIRPYDQKDHQRLALLKLRGTLLQIMHRDDPYIGVDQNSTRDLSDVGVVWDQMKAAVHIEKLQEELDTVTNSQTFQEIQTTLDRLKAEYPIAETIKEQFSEDWARIKDAVDLEGFAQQLANSSGLSDSDVHELRDAYDSLAKLAESDLAKIRDKMYNRWTKLQDDGTLPKVEDVRATVKEYMDKAKVAIESAQSSASEAFNHVQDMWQKWWS